MNQSKLVTMAVIAMVVLMIVISLSNSIFHNIDAGEQGVLFKPFTGGLEKDRIYGQGFHVVAPWNDMFVYNVQTND